MLGLLTLAAAIGSGLMAGVFMAFSTAVMTALGRLPPAHGVAAMQSISLVIVNAWFLTPFFGTAAACLVITAAALVQGHQPGAAYPLAGSGLYLGGVLLVTAAANVPLNNALAGVTPHSPEAARLWAVYLSTWTGWNHVRTAAALAAAVCFTIAYRRS